MNLWAGTAAPLLAAALLAGCATRPPELAGLPWTSGRLAIRIEPLGDQPLRSVSAAFDLRGDSQRGELRLLSPLGTLLAQARWTPTETSLTTTQGQRHFADLESLSREALGEALPLRALPDWLAGRPWPIAPSQPLNQTSFEQLGWRVQVGQGAPGLIQAHRDTPPAVTLRAWVDR